MILQNQNDWEFQSISDSNSICNISLVLTLMSISSAKRNDDNIFHKNITIFMVEKVRSGAKLKFPVNRGCWRLTSSDVISFTYCWCCSLVFWWTTNTLRYLKSLLDHVIQLLRTLFHRYPRKQISIHIWTLQNRRVTTKWNFLSQHEIFSCFC